MKVSYPRFFAPPADHFFLMGPRGTGKTWWLKEHFPQALRLDLLEPEMHRHLAARPERLRDLVLARPECPQVIIDEVQKLPELLEVAHLLIEAKLDKQFVFSGSSARKLRRAGVNLLGGRAAHKTLHPYMAAEMGQGFAMETALQLGLLPLIHGAREPVEALRAYHGLYLREEVQMEGLVRQIGSFARFLEALSFSHGAVLNLAEVARECQVNRKTAEGYLEILEDLLLAYRLPVFTRRARRQMATHPKFYFFDTGVYRAIRPRGPLDTPEEIAGAALEGLVAQHLRAWCDYTPGDHQLYFWQTRSQAEVDFVVYGESAFHAFEVKHSQKLSAADFRGLKSFGEDYPTSQRWLLYRGQERLLVDGIFCLPCAEFLSELRPGQFPARP
jgi:uncharacterized protein